jgi:hypothetical protein
LNVRDAPLRPARAGRTPRVETRAERARFRFELRFESFDVDLERRPQSDLRAARVEQPRDRPAGAVQAALVNALRGVAGQHAGERVRRLGRAPNLR